MLMGKLDIYTQKHEVDSLLYAILRNQPQRHQRLHRQENIRGKFYDISMGNNFLFCFVLGIIPPPKLIF